MQYTNQLAHEKSPYLLQHAHNPVDWLPWGEAAFARARAENKPIFLSIGYSTCHWCHVMERESFENESVAAIMNENYINIKVDREERPDVDRVYMTFVQATTGSGGWPLSVFLTPDLKPFHGGTYFPPSDAYGRMGFASLLQRLAEAWHQDRERVEQSGDNVLEALQQYAAVGGGAAAVDRDAVIERGYAQLARSYDSRYGGFGEAPKFPRPVQHDFLHYYYATRGQQDALRMSMHTLGAMTDGGMDDQLGGGYHRYSVDEQWIVSHFEKMLYDQAQLVVSLLEMYQLSGDDYFAIAARNTLDYVLRDMAHPAGGFYSAEDADSYPYHGADHKEEGAFYAWTEKEIQEALGEQAAAIFSQFYGVRPEGNAPPQGDPHGEFRGKNILYRATTLSALTEKTGLGVEEVTASLLDSQQILFAIRNQRPRPHLDDKIITAWNGLMISAFARAAQVLDEPQYLQAAQRAAAFIRAELYDTATQRLRRHYREGAAEVAGYADDYAYLVRGLIDLYEADFNYEHLRWAEDLTETLNRDFWDADGGGYFNSMPDPHLLLRMKEDYDGAEPSANSIAAMNNLRLAQLLDRSDLAQKAEVILNLFAERLQHAPHAMPAMLCAAMAAAQPPQHVVIVGKRDNADTQELLRAVRQRFAPFRSVVFLEADAANPIAERQEFMQGMTLVDGNPAAYMCRDFACQRPVTSAKELDRLLDETRPIISNRT